MGGASGGVAIELCFDALLEPCASEHALLLQVDADLGDRFVGKGVSKKVSE